MSEPCLRRGHRQKLHSYSQRAVRGGLAARTAPLATEHPVRQSNATEAMHAAGRAEGSRCGEGMPTGRYACSELLGRLAATGLGGHGRRRTGRGRCRPNRRVGGDPCSLGGGRFGGECGSGLLRGIGASSFLSRRCLLHRSAKRSAVHRGCLGVLLRPLLLTLCLDLPRGLLDDALVLCERTG